jgi:hypothetical protein
MQPLLFLSISRKRVMHKSSTELLFVTVSEIKLETAQVYETFENELSTTVLKLSVPLELGLRFLITILSNLFIYLLYFYLPLPLQYPTIIILVAERVNVLGRRTGLWYTEGKV